MVTKALKDRLVWFFAFYYGMFSFTNAHTASQTALYSEYNEMCTDISAAAVARGIFTLLLSADTDIECLTTAQVLCFLSVMSYHS